MPQDTDDADLPNSNKSLTWATLKKISGIMHRAQEDYINDMKSDDPFYSWYYDDKGQRL
jgi:hypothetical protein